MPNPVSLLAYAHTYPASGFSHALIRYDMFIWGRLTLIKGVDVRDKAELYVNTCYLRSQNNYRYYNSTVYTRVHSYKYTHVTVLAAVAVRDGENLH